LRRRETYAGLPRPSFFAIVFFAIVSCAFFFCAIVIFAIGCLIHYRAMVSA
jgi:hypothetical protein